MRVDFHCHTTASDGSLPPQDLIARAVENNLDMLAITDHDTLLGYQGLQTPENLSLIPGIELSTVWNKVGIHIVGLNINPESDAMIEAVEFQLHARESRAEMIAEKLESYGVESPLEGAKRFAGGAIGRPHFAQHMTETGFSKDANDAFKKYLGNGKPCDIKVCWPDLKRVINWITDGEGVAVLAHPGRYNMTRTKLLKLLDSFQEFGGQALEVVSGMQTPNQTKDYEKMCQQLNLAASMGSDFHSPTQHWLDLGKFSPVPQNLKPVWELWQ